MSLKIEKDITKEVNTNSDNSMEVFNSRSHFWGRLTLYVLILMCLVPPLYLSIYLGAHPGWDVILAGLVRYAAFIGIMWVLEPITYFPTLGVAGTYLAFLTGNVSSMCLPCSIAAQKAVGAETGSKKAELAGVFGIAIASIVNIVIIIFMILGGSYLMSLLPTVITDVFDFILPSVFGAVLGQFAYKTPLYGVVAIVIGMIVLFSPILSLIKIVVCVALTITALIFMEKMKR